MSLQSALVRSGIAASPVKLWPPCDATPDDEDYLETQFGCTGVSACFFLGDMEPRRFELEAGKRQLNRFTVCRITATEERY